MEDNIKKWFLAVSSNNINLIDEMLEDGFDVNAVDENGMRALQHVAKNLYTSISSGNWNEEQLLKEIAGTLIIHGAKHEDMGHKGGEYGDILRATIIHIIKTATLKGERAPIDNLINDSQIWFKNDSSSIKDLLYAAVDNKDIVSIEKMLEYDLVGTPPSE